MNFNGDLIRHINKNSIETTAKEIKNGIKHVVEDITAEKSKDIEKVIHAENSLGRASFSILKEVSQFELGSRVDKFLKKLNYSNAYENYYINKFKNACSSNGKYDEKFVSIADEFINLADAKPEELKFVWESYLPDCIDAVKNTDGSFNIELYECVKELLKDNRISTRGIRSIMDGCKELHFDQRTGKYTTSLNKKAFQEYKDFMKLNGTKVFESNDTFTLYLGDTFNGATSKGNYLQEGKDYIFDEVAFNFAKKNYEQGADIINMDSFLNSFILFDKETNRATGFRFEPSKASRWVKDMILELKESLGEKVSEACKVNGEDSLHNLLVADTLHKKNIKSYELPGFIESLKDKEGFARTDITSYLLKKDGNIYNYHVDEIQKYLLNPNGSVNGQAYQKVLEKKLKAQDIDLARVNGAINFDNLDTLEEIYKRQGAQKFEDYQIAETFKFLKNKDGIVEKRLLPYLDDLKQYTHLMPKELKDCMTESGEIDLVLFELKKDILKQHGYLTSKFVDICKNADGSANMDGVEAMRTLLHSGLSAEQPLINSFKTPEGFNLKEFKEFMSEFEKTDYRFRNKILKMAGNGNTVDIKYFNSLKEAMNNPEIAPLMENRTNAMIVQSKFKTLKEQNNLLKDDFLMYDFAHQLPKDIEILEKNGYAARFYKELGTEEKYFIEVPKSAVEKFENNFIKSDCLDNIIKKADFRADVANEYTISQLSKDINNVLNSLNDNEKKILTRAFKLEPTVNGLEGFPQRMPKDSIPPNGLETQFKTINEAINKFYSSKINSQNPETNQIINEIVEAFPEFKILIGKTGQKGERIDLKTLEELKNLINSQEYKVLSQEDKTVAKMTVLMNSLEHIDSHPNIVKRVYHTDNDGLTLTINADWKKKAEYTNSIIERFDLSEKEKYRIVQLLNDIGWSKELEAGKLSYYDIAVNQRFKGDESVSPLIEKIVTGECKYDAQKLTQEVKNMRANQQLLQTTDIKELEPYIETKVINGKTLKYVNITRPELRDKAFLAHFLGYDNFDHTLNLMKNRAYRSAFSTSVMRGGTNNGIFAGRRTGIVLSGDSLNIAEASHSNVDSGFGKQYKYLKDSLKGSYYQEIKQTFMKNLNLNEEEYAKLMEETINKPLNSITDCTINGKNISRQEILDTHNKGINKILESEAQNEVTVLNPKPIGIIGHGSSLDAYEMQDAVKMAQSNDMVLLWKKQ